MITKSLQSVKLQESPIQKSQGGQTKKKKANRVVFKTEIDENNNLQVGFQTQRKSYDCVTVENKINSYNLISSMYELETKNMDLYVDLQDKTTQIQLMQAQIEQQKIKHQSQIRQYILEKEELLLRIQNLEKQSELQQRYIEQLPQFEVEAQEWKIRFLKLNKQFHLQQETLVRLEAEQQSSQRRHIDILTVTSPYLNTKANYCYNQFNKPSLFFLSNQLYEMQEDLDLQERLPLSPSKYSLLKLMKRDSYFINYNESDEMREIQEDREKIQQEYENIEFIIGHQWEVKKTQNKINENDEMREIGEYWDIFQQQSVDIQDNIGIDQNKIDVLSPPKQSDQQKKSIKKKFQDKSYCRYILLYVFRTIENKQFAEIIGDICSQFQVNYDTFVEYYRKQRILIMGYQALKKELIYENQSLPIQNRKKAFKQVLAWYLDKLATKHILSSKKQNFKEYLKFKNYVMSYYIHNPKSWAGNKPQWTGTDI
ncbi:unnamed protein product [Paramecium octaurelia]|uniref:Uncharacterized protein n=1 Tax=Paramecium octaurelia TaxID=43137 RepID=A0A8S1YG88_PAROT|nr:unnamed protein product [Paramecium octaurelia]